MEMHRQVALSLVFVALLVGSALVLLAQSDPDPLAEFRGADGGVTVTSGRFTRELQRLLFGPGPSPVIETTVWRPEQSPYPTASWTGQTFTRPNLNVYTPQSRDIEAEKARAAETNVFFESITDAVKGFFSFDWLVGTASAADRFLVLGGAGCVTTTIATDIDCWSTTSGGAGGASVPGTADVALADANSGAGTGTQDAAMSVLGLTMTGFTGTWATGNFALTFGTTGFTLGGTLNAGSSTITSAGNVTMGSGVAFNEGTSTLVLNYTGNLQMDVAGGAGTNNLYNVTFGASSDVTVATFDLGVANVLTTNASAVINSNCTRAVYLNGATATPFSRGASTVVWAPIIFNTSVGATVPAGQYRGTGSGSLQFASAQTFTPDGNVSVANCVASPNNGTVLISAGTYVKGATTLDAGALTMSGGDLTSTSGAVTLSGAVNISSAASAIDFGSETWTVSGTWTNASTDGTVWEAGTGTMTFDTGVASTMTFAGTNLAEDEFSSVTFNSTAAITYTMATRGLRLGGTLTIADTATAVTLDTAGLALTVGALTLGPTNGTLTLGATAMTLNGAVNMNAGSTWNANTATITIAADTSWAWGGTFNRGTSQVTVTGFNVVFTGTAQQFYNFTFNNRTTGPVLAENNVTGASGCDFLNLNSGGLTVGATLTLNCGIRSSGVIGDGGGTYDLNIVTINASGHIDWGSSTASIISGAYTNNCNPCNVNWNAGTGTVTFDNTATNTVTLSANLAENEFNSVSFTSASASSVTFTLATGSLDIGGTLTINSDSILARGTLLITGATGLTIGPTGTNALTETSGAMTISGSVSVSNATSYITFGSGAWTVAGDWDNSSTSASWDAGTGSMTFTSSTAQSMTFATFTTWEAEFASVTFNSSAATAVTFTGAGGPLGFATTLTITDTSSTTTLSMGTASIRGDTSATIDMTDADGRLSFTTGNIVDVSDLNITGGQMTMDGISGITDLRIQSAAPDDFDITAWVLYTITGGGVPDIRWTMDPDAGNTNVTVTAEGLTAFTTFSIYRDTIDIQQAASNGGGVLVFSGGALNSGWSTHDMIIALPGLTFGGGGGGGPAPPPTVIWTWRHLSEDLTVELTTQTGTANAQYQWIVNGKVVGTGARIEYQFPLSGIYKVTLHAKILDFEMDTAQNVVAQSVSFLGRYFPVLALVLIALWFIILIIVEAYDSDAGRIYAISAALLSFGVALILLARGYRTFPLSGEIALMAFASVGLICASGTVKGRLVAAILFAIGLVLGWLVYGQLL